MLNLCYFFQLVSNAIGFLALVAEKDRNKALFNNPETMSGICQKVIVPNMEFRGEFLSVLLRFVV